jgi:hypothetical protein
MLVHLLGVNAIVSCNDKFMVSPNYHEQRTQQCNSCRLQGGDSTRDVAELCVTKLCCKVGYYEGHSVYL